MLYLAEVISHHRAPAGTIIGLPWTSSVCNCITTWTLEGGLIYWAVPIVKEFTEKVQADLQKFSSLRLNMSELSDVSTCQSMWLMWSKGDVIANNSISSLLTHCPLGDVELILKVWFSKSLYRIVAWVLVKLLLAECHKTSLMISQHWFR